MIKHIYTSRLEGIFSTKKLWEKAIFAGKPTEHHPHIRQPIVQDWTSLGPVSAKDFTLNFFKDHIQNYRTDLPPNLIAMDHS